MKTEAMMQEEVGILILTMEELITETTPTDPVVTLEALDIG